MEGREPAHVHIGHSGRYAKFWLDPVALAYNRGFRAHEIGDIQGIVVSNAPYFRERWYEFFGSHG
jgi:hypothetical protein